MQLLDTYLYHKAIEMDYKCKGYNKTAKERPLRQSDPGTHPIATLQGAELITKGWIWFY